MTDHRMASAELRGKPPLSMTGFLVVEMIKDHYFRVALRPHTEGKVPGFIEWRVANRPWQSEAKSGGRRTVSAVIVLGLPMPGTSAARRDVVGAHTCERVDRPVREFGHTDGNRVSAQAEQ